MSRPCICGHSAATHTPACAAPSLSRYQTGGCRCAGYVAAPVAGEAIEVRVNGHWRAATVSGPARRPGEFWAESDVGGRHPVGRMRYGVDWRRKETRD